MERRSLLISVLLRKHPLVNLTRNVRNPMLPGRKPPKVCSVEMSVDWSSDIIVYFKREQQFNPGLRHKTVTLAGEAVVFGPLTVTPFSISDLQRKCSLTERNIEVSVYQEGSSWFLRLHKKTLSCTQRIAPWLVCLRSFVVPVCIGVLSKWLFSL
jgi:hypothetical protein